MAGAAQAELILEATASRRDRESDFIKITSHRVISQLRQAVVPGEPGEEFAIDVNRVVCFVECDTVVVQPSVWQVKDECDCRRLKQDSAQRFVIVSDQWQNLIAARYHQRAISVLAYAVNRSRFPTAIRAELIAVRQTHRSGGNGSGRIRDSNGG